MNRDKTVDYMYKIVKYESQDRMGDLICDNYPMLLVLSRFGMSLGFGEQSIGEVCKSNNVDVKTFLAVVNLLIDDSEKIPKIIDAEISIPALIKYLCNSHKYFVEFRLPLIRQELVNALGDNKNDVNLVIIKYYDEYVYEVNRHITYEERKVFKYVESLIDTNVSNKYNIEIFSKRHDDVECKLSELKDIIIKYYPNSSSNELNSVLFDIFSCAKDLESHNRVENALFIPAIKELERLKKID